MRQLNARDNHHDHSHRRHRRDATMLVYVLLLFSAVVTASVGSPPAVDKADHWAYKPLTVPPVPNVAAGALASRVRTPVDAFVFAKLAEKGLTPSSEADRRTLIRRVSYDLIGLPPTPAEVDAFLADPDPLAYEKLVDRLLASPRYGERWARHWLDTVHYGDTHGYDKDKVRPNAWPYRDYVIRSLNDDKPYARFVREQLAGDRVYPGTPDGIVALGFIAAGPFDWVGQVELRDDTIDKAITRNLDRDDMVATAMNTFVSLTAQCARCHDHKFDPVTQADYYSLQAVFAEVDRADRPYERDPVVAKLRQALRQQLGDASASKAELEAIAAKKVGQELLAIDVRLAAATKPRASKGERPEFGYHSAIEQDRTKAKWVQVDLGDTKEIASVTIVGAHDPFAGIGAGFGFPVRFKIEASDDATFAPGIRTIVDRAAADVMNPGVTPQRFVTAEGTPARFVRVTATTLALRQADYIFALGELMVTDRAGENVAAGRMVTALDSIEAPPRWGRKNLVDGYAYGGEDDAENRAATVQRLAAERNAVLESGLDAASVKQYRELERSLRETQASLAALPQSGVVFAAATEFEPSGSFRPTRGKPREVRVLKRGSEKDPGEEAGPGTVACVPGLPSRFQVPPDDEAARRAAFADWVTDSANPLTWRSIVNRVWQYHFGRGIVETPSDFGRMGAAPTHPELLDYLAATFRDGGQSIKSLHRLIVTSSTYRQSSADDPARGAIDAGNQYLWRMNRQRLDAEAVRDTILLAAGKLDLAIGGPGFRDFAFEDDHSPRYRYQEHDPDDPKTHRRAIYRMIVRSVPDPFMETLDCADPSQAVPRRNETLTPLQALTMMNNPFVVRMAGHLAERVRKESPDEVTAQIDAAYRLTLCRPATADERAVLTALAERRGLPAACRVILNTNEFTFVD